MNKKTNLVWIDLEMTGLDPDKDVILEIATIITDEDLNIIEEGPCLAIHQSDAVLGVMNPWVREMHQESGLIERVRESKVTLKQAEKQTLDFIKKYCDPGEGRLCGNSVWKDRAFLGKYMPAILDSLHYRLIDVTAVKELVLRWYPNAEFEKKNSHRALDDIRESIEELRYYRKNFFAGLN